MKRKTHFFFKQNGFEDKKFWVCFSVSFPGLLSLAFRLEKFSQSLYECENKCMREVCYLLWLSSWLEWTRLDSKDDRKNMFEVLERKILQLEWMVRCVSRLSSIKNATACYVLFLCSSCLKRFSCFDHTMMDVKSSAMFPSRVCVFWQNLTKLASDLLETALEFIFSATNLALTRLQSHEFFIKSLQLNQSSSAFLSTDFLSLCMYF